MYRNTDTGWASRAGSADLKTIVAVVFALGGLSWAVIAMMSGRGDSSAGDGPRVIASAIDEQGNAVEPDYTSTSGTKRLGAATDEIERVVSAESSGVISALSGPKGAPEGVSEAVVNAFVPLLTGDHDAFLAAIEAMGGVVPGDLDGEHPIFKHLSKEFAGAKIDLDRITVRKYVPQDRQGMGMRQTREVNEEANEEADGERIQTQTQRMEMRPQSMFPDTPESSDPSAIEVQIPVQPKGEELETIFALILTWNADARMWQPATYGIVKHRLIEEEG